MKLHTTGKKETESRSKGTVKTAKIETYLVFTLTHCSLQVSVINCVCDIFGMFDVDKVTS